MKKILITFTILTSILTACSSTKMETKPTRANSGAQITSPDFNETQK